MKTWEEYITEDIGTYEEKYRPVEVECPKCKNRLYKRIGILTTNSYPPRYEYMCLECGWTGYARK